MNNAEHVEIVHSRGFSIKAWGPGLLMEGFAEGDLPEINVLDQYADHESIDGHIPIDDGFWWGGEGSSGSITLLREVLGCFDGEADLVVFWEHGQLTGLRLRDHKVTEHLVLVSLGEETP